MTFRLRLLGLDLPASSLSYEPVEEPGDDLPTLPPFKATLTETQDASWLDKFAGLFGADVVAPTRAWCAVRFEDQRRLRRQLARHGFRGRRGARRIDFNRVPIVGDRWDLDWPIAVDMWPQEGT